jgi:hypothetical protein
LAEDCYLGPAGWVASGRHPAFVDHPIKSHEAVRIIAATLEPSRPQLGVMHSSTRLLCT